MDGEHNSWDWTRTNRTDVCSHGRHDIEERLSRVEQTEGHDEHLGRPVDNGRKQLPQNIAMTEGFQRAPSAALGFVDG